MWTKSDTLVDKMALYVNVRGYVCGCLGIRMCVYKPLMWIAWQAFINIIPSYFFK